MEPKNEEPIFKSQEMTIEEVHALYFNDDALRAQPEPVYVLNSPQGKIYYTFNQKTFKPEYFMAVTTLISNQMPLPKAITDKMLDMGKVAFNTYTNERSLYGTFMDIEYNKFLMNGTYDMESIPEVVRAYHKECGSTVPPERWIEEFNTDITAFAQWVHDYDVKPLAIGIMLVSRNYGIGGRLDLACEMNNVKYSEKTPLSDRKRVRRNVDYKSGKSGFHDSHILQGKGYNILWDENFPEYPMEGYANFAPKAWRKEPTYDFKDHSDNKVVNKLEHYIELQRIDQLEPNQAIKMFKGSLTVGQPVTGNFIVEELDAFITTKMLKYLGHLSD